MNKQNVLPKREEVKKEYKWNIEHLYKSDDLWEEDFRDLKKKVEQFSNYQGTMSESATSLYKVLKAQDELNMQLEKIYVYANQKNHEDMANSTYQQLAGRAQTLMAELSNALSFIEPELLAIPRETIEAFLKEEPKLKMYERYILEKFRTKEHILSEEMEAVLAKVYEIGQGPQNIFQMFNNADIDFGMVHDDNGNEVQLTHGRYVHFLESHNCAVRKEAFEATYKQYEAHKNTLAATYQANVQQELFFARMRKYNSAREAALDQSHIPVSVYDKLIDAVHENMSKMYDYVALRKKALGVEELHMYDVYVPLVEQIDKKYSFEEAKEIVKAGLAPLGEEYLSILQEGFDNGWIDIYENQGKRSGAYSWGAYGTHPYVLLNYNGSLNHVFTLAHEMGHSMHSYYSDATQPYPYAGYRIFVAEVASTCNEALLIHYLLKNAKDDVEKAYLINYFLDQFKGTLYRQTMFAEFEKITHEKVQNGESLTADNLCEIYYNLNKLYFGEDMISDEQIAMEWSRIPHFYSPFYVYQYATGFSAAIAISSKILTKEDGIVEKYKKFLSGGSSMDCIDLLKLCGVDMTSEEPVNEALRVFGEYVELMKQYIS